MSRVGKQPVAIPSNVKSKVEGQSVAIEGPKGKLSIECHPRMTVKQDGDTIVVTRPTDQTQDKALHGLTRSLINNMVVGVVEGFQKELELQGVGFRAQMKGKSLSLALGFSHPIDYKVPEGIKIETPKQDQIVITGIDKCLVGQVAADIRAYYVPEPYKGKGVRYKGEYVRRKQGKSVS